jgi:protein subunit release factor B
MFTSPFKREVGAPTYQLDVSYAATRELLSGLTVAESQRLTAKTEEVYIKVAKSKKFKEETIDMQNGAKGHWLGPSDAKNVLIFFHGMRLSTTYKFH